VTARAAAGPLRRSLKGARAVAAAPTYTTTRDTTAVGRSLSTIFDGWMERFRVLQALETIEPALFRNLLGWALQDLRDVFLARIAEPEALPAHVREKCLGRLKAEAVVIQSAIRAADFAAVEGFAGEVLRRRGISYDPLSAAFRSFVRAVAPVLLEARLNEIVRMDPQGGLSWNQSGIFPIEEATKGIDLPRPDPRLSGRTIGDCASALMSELACGNRHGQKTLDQYRQTFGLLIKFLGDRPLSQVAKADGARFKTFIQRLPAKYGQAARYAGCSLAEIIATADRIGDMNRVKPQTWNRHAVALHTLGDYARRHGDTTENVFEELWIKRKKDAEDTERDEHDRLGREKLLQIFSSPVFTGMRSKQLNHKFGDLVVFDNWFWVPLISVTTGMRCEEIAQLQIDDVLQVSGVLCIQVKRGPGRKVKSAAAKRNIPIPDALFRLGFATFVEDRKRIKSPPPDRLLIPGCGATGKYKLKGTVTAKWFGRYLKGLGMKGEKESFHSLRHDFASEATAARVNPTIFDYIFGHRTGRLAFDRYTSKIEPVAAEEINKIDFDFLANVRPYQGKV
jgi:integrase